MTATQFRRWMARHGYTIARLSAELGISPRQIGYYRSGEQVVPRVVALACRELAR